MVAKIKSGRSIRGILNYNENKVREGKAECIGANLYGRDASMLSFDQKYNRLTNLTMLNKRTKTNAIHISLNFDPSEILSDELLNRIALDYMEKIGFGSQPFLVYRHYDAAHPHIHLVTTNIDYEGNRIDIHNIGRNQSENARREIEKEYGLLQADSKKQEILFQPQRIIPEKVIYGKSETRRAIAGVLSAVLREYRYTSLPELNAILNKYGVTADRGNEGSKIYQLGGLVYSVISEKGKKVGVPIKASAFYGRATLKDLEKEFAMNKEGRKPYRDGLRDQVEKALEQGENLTLAQFAAHLHSECIDVIFRSNEQGRAYGVTFIDHHNKVVFNGSDLGRNYSADRLFERFAILNRLEKSEGAGSLQPNKDKGNLQSVRPENVIVERELQDKLPDDRTPVSSAQMISDLLKAEWQPDGTSVPAGRRRRKGKRRHIQ